MKVSLVICQLIVTNRVFKTSFNVALLKRTRQRSNLLGDVRKFKGEHLNRD